MGVIRMTGVPCAHCGERTWYTREPEEARSIGRDLLALALVPVRILDSTLSYLAGSDRSPLGSSYGAQVKRSMKAEALRKSDRVKGVDVAPGEKVCASCGHRIYGASTEQ